jgi:hypothetical protein
MGKKFEILDSFQVNSRAISENAQELYQDALDSDAGPNLKVTIDATHSGRLTNMRVYPGARMKRSVKTFLKPYAKPVLKHHDASEDAIGRVQKARYIQLTQNEDKFLKDFINPSSGIGSGFIQLDVLIADQEMIPKFLDGRFQNVSTRQSSDEAFCSICGKDMLQEEYGIWDHEHKVGQTYNVKPKSGKGKGKEHLCYLITGDLDYREVSVVNIPGDDHALIEGFEMVKEQDNPKDALMICCGDGLFATMDSLELTTSKGKGVVDLFGVVTSKDRQKVTGKTIIAVSPVFDSQYMEGTNMKEEDVNPETEKETQDTDESVDNTEENDSVDKASDDADQDAGQEDSKEEKTEGVVAPDNSTDEGSGSADTSVLSEGALAASVEALSSKVNALNDDKKDLESEVVRLKGSIEEKDEEITKVRSTAQDSLAETKQLLAEQLLTSKLFLRKPDVSKVVTAEDYQAMLTKYADRTVESLKDALEDLTPEVIDFSKEQGIMTSASLVAEEKVTSPVANVKPKDEEDKETSLPDLTREEALENYLDN